MAKQSQNPRKVAVDILARWAQTGGKIDEIRDHALERTNVADQRDRALVTELVYGVVRHYDEIQDVLKKTVRADLDKMQADLRAILQCGVYQLLHLDRIPEHAAVNESVNLARSRYGQKAAGMVNGVLRGVQRKKGEIVPASWESGNLALWRAKWEAQWGTEKAQQLIEFYKSARPTIPLRRNLLRTESDREWREILKQEHIETVLVDGWPGYVYVKSRVKPATLRSFKQGKTTVQDPATGISVHLLDPQPGDRVLDLCCAPGGKSAHIWERMRGNGSVTAVDKSARRNEKTREALVRMRHKAIQVLDEDVLEYEAEPFDRVLVDVPCSGTGVAHRRADLLARRGPGDVKEIAELQEKLLLKAASLVKPGGILVYSTCSLEPEENRLRAEWFDRTMSGTFERAALPKGLLKSWVLGPGEAGTWPPEHHVDGAFAVRWRRII